MDTQSPAGAAGTPGHGPGPQTARPPYGTPPGAPPPQENAFWAGVRRTGLVRTQDRWIGGVAGGVAARLGVDPLLVRGLIAVSFLLGGLGLVLYGVAWALLPEQSDGRIHLEELGAGRSDVALLGALAFVVVGLARGDGWWWFWDGEGWFTGLLWLGFLVGVGALVVTALRRRPGVPTPPPGGPYPAPAAGTVPVAGPAPAAGTTWGATPPAGPATTVPLPPVAAPGAPVPPVGPPPPPLYGSAPYGSPPPAPRPPAPPRPPRPPRNGADAATVGAVVGLSALGLAALLLAERADVWSGSVWLTTGGIALVIAGLGIVTLGLRGRSSGFVGFLAIAGALVWVPSALVAQVDSGWWTSDDGPVTSDERVFTSRDDAERGVSVGMGSSRVDLTAVPLDEADPLRVPVDLGAGELVVVVPADAAVSADVTVGAGSLTWELDGQTLRHEGVALDGLQLDDEAVQSGSAAQIVLTVDVGAGEIRIIEEDAA